MLATCTWDMVPASNEPQVYPHTLTDLHKRFAFQIEDSSPKLEKLSMHCNTSKYLKNKQQKHLSKLRRSPMDSNSNYLLTTSHTGRAQQLGELNYSKTNNNDQSHQIL